MASEPQPGEGPLRGPRGQSTHASAGGIGWGAALGGHEILYQLKAGGMGEVLLARRRGPSGFERLVALKIIRAELRGQDPLRRMFLDEAQLLARLSHPAIAQIFDFGEDDGVLFLAMEYVAGVSFRDLVALSPPPAVSARAMAEVCRALHVAHELTDLAGNPLVVVHRDVSPDNLMLTFDGQVKVLDFGIALMRGRQAPVTEYGTIKGKPPYLSPEQIKNLPVDRRTDVFAASAVLHELLTGRQVFDGDSVYAIARAIELDDVAPPSVVAGPLPAGLDEATMRGLERDPDRRWQSTEELARALDGVVAGVGCETLAEYAARQLAEEQRRHREWLRAVIEQGAKANRRTGRASGIVTARAAAFDPDGPTLDGTLPGRGRRRVLVALVGAAAVTVSLGALWLAREPGRQRPTAAADPPADAAAGPPTTAAVFADSPGSGGAAADSPAGADVAAADEPSRSDVAVAPSSSPPPAAAPQSSTGAAPIAVTDESDSPRADETRRKKRSTSREKRPIPRPRSPTRVPRGPGTGGARAPGEAPAGPAAEPEGTGSITLRTQAGSAWARVRIDGKDAGITPMKRDVGSGSHEIEFVRPDNDEVRHRRRVHVMPGQHVEVVAP